MNKSQLEKLMGLLMTIDQVIEEDPEGTEEIKSVLKPLQGKVSQELQNIVWKEYLDTKAPPG